MLDICLTGEHLPDVANSSSRTLSASASFEIIRANASGGTHGAILPRNVRLILCSVLFIKLSKSLVAGGRMSRRIADNTKFATASAE